VEPGALLTLGDPDRIQQVAWNLLSNAVKFTPAGGRVHVRLRRVADGDELSVSDTGIGIAADFMPNVFEAFRQADASSTRAHGGLGLGLSIVRHIVEMHGGTVHAWSNGSGEGATFTVRLPVRVETAPAPEQRQDALETRN
jgi:signal transduction histidine kinase